MVSIWTSQKILLSVKGLRLDMGAIEKGENLFETDTIVPGKKSIEEIIG